MLFCLWKAGSEFWKGKGLSSLFIYWSQSCSQPHNTQRWPCLFCFVFLANPLEEALFCVYFSVFQSGVSLVRDLSQWCQTCTEESKAAGLAFSYLLLNPRSHVSALASSRFLTDHKASLCSLSPSCHWCSLRHYHLGCMSGKGKICCSTSRKQLEEEKSGTPYSRSRGGGHRWDWWQLLELVMCVVCFQLSQGVWL